MLNLGWKPDPDWHHKGKSDPDPDTIPSVTHVGKLGKN